MRDDNRVHISGSTVNGSMAVGSHAQATTYHTTTGTGGDDLRAALADLRRLIAAYPQQIDPRAGRDVEDIEAEAAQPEPDPDRIRDALSRLAGRVGAVGTLVAAVARVGELVRHVLP